VSISSSYKESRDKVLKLINNLNWSNSFFRKDIGFKVIDK
jgi:phosphoribosylamine-glycine ligase